jgi:hypothetical protein
MCCGTDTANINWHWYCKQTLTIIYCFSCGLREKSIIKIFYPCCDSHERFRFLYSRGCMNFGYRLSFPSLTYFTCLFVHNDGKLWSQNFWAVLSVGFIFFNMNIKYHFFSTVVYCFRLLKLCAELNPPPPRVLEGLSADKDLFETWI